LKDSEEEELPYIMLKMDVASNSEQVFEQTRVFSTMTVFFQIWGNMRTGRRDDGNAGMEWKCERTSRGIAGDVGASFEAGPIGVPAN